MTVRRRKSSMNQEQQLAYRKSESEKRQARRKRQLEKENTNQDEM